MRFLNFVWILGLLTPLLPAQIDIEEGPIPGRLYSRDLATNQAVVPISGKVVVPNCDRIHLVVNQDGIPWSSDVANLDYSNGDPPFVFKPTIEAGLRNYSFELLLESGGQTQRAIFVDHIVCGDVFLINGQSNAVASDYHNEGLGNQNQTPWVRSYGSSSLVEQEVVSDAKWHIADGIQVYASGTVGAWGLRAASLISDRFQIPIGLLNGAVGGTTVSQHARDDIQPENLSTIYGRLLYRAREAGIDQTVRGLLWHQGESDGPTPPADYIAAWRELRNDWLYDYPALEHLFVFQVRRGCGISNMKIREIQRTCGDFFSDVTVLPTTGINEHDGCHFTYSGYRRMGNWMAAAIAKRLYGVTISDKKLPPNLKEARFTSPTHDEIELVFRSTNQTLVLDPGVESYMSLGAGINESVVSASTSPGRIILTLSGSTAATEIIYRGHMGAGPWIKNSDGVGAFTFRVPIIP